MCIVCAGLIILTRPLAHILYARDFYAAWRYVPFLLVSSVINCASGLLGPILSAKKDSKAMMLSALVGAGVNIILNIALVYAIGIQGATIATVICSYIIYAVRKKAVGKDIYIKNYYIVILTWSILFIQSIVESYFANYIIEIILIRTQDLQPIYEETSGFYIYTHDVMTELHRRIGENPFIVEIGEIESIDIDEAEDFIIADAVYNHIFKKDVK